MLNLNGSLIRFAVATLAVIGALFAAPAQAENWPTRPVRFIVPFGPGAGADIGARLFAEKLSQKWGQAVVVENRPGGDSIVAIQAFLSANDDHVLLFGPAGNFTVHPFNYSKLSYNPADLIPIARASNTILALAVKQDAPYKTAGDYLKAAASGEFKMGGAQSKDTDEVLTRMIEKAGKVKLTYIPFKSGADAVNAALAGQAQLVLDAIPVVVPHVRDQKLVGLAIAQPQLQAGKIKILAVLNSVRAPVYPDIPTVADAGYPNMTIDGLVGLFGTPSTPQALREKIAADVKEVMDTDPIIKDRLTATAQLPNPGTPEEFAKALEDQRAKLAQNARDLGVKEKQ